MIDAPLWIAKPTLDALANPKVPAPIGGPNGLAAKVFDQAYEVRQAVRKLVLGSDVTLPNPNDPKENTQQETTLARGSSQENQQPVSRSSVAPQSATNVDEAGIKQDKQDLTEISTPPQSVQPAPAKVNMFSIVRGPDNSSPDNQGRTTVNNTGVNVRNQLQGAAENAQNQLQNAVENAQTQVANTFKRFTPTVGSGASKPASEGTGTNANSTSSTSSTSNSNSKVTRRNEGLPRERKLPGHFPFQNTIVWLPYRMIRSSQCQSTARDNTARSTSAPRRVRSPTLCR